MTEASEIDEEARRLETARARCPKAEALADDIRALLNRSDIALDPGKAKARTILEVVLVGVGGFIETGYRDIYPSEEEALRRRMEEVVGDEKGR